MEENTEQIRVNHEMTSFDEEWVNLVFEAKQMGLTIREIYTFLQSAAEKGQA
ncbi:anti-repressor SinI family protein [Ectobacillus sp. sgz5001026]|uniref:anti-repressor SinI family protein n=1 Tax=Ectobacillus sp. sgz5001026 TaxID=3242473 RepID=UPI0036D435BF